MWCVVRTVNYTVKGRDYVPLDPHDALRTENYLGRLYSDGKFVGPTLMRDLSAAPRSYADVRLVSIGGILTASASIGGPNNTRRIARLHLDASGNVERADIQPSNQIYEKNWMPLSVNGEFKWIYSIDPTAILPGPLRECPFALDHLRGGAAIAFESGYLCVTHEVTEVEAGLIYLHRFVRLDNRFNVTAVSPTWVFAHHGIEFCAGLALDGSSLVLSYGVEDREAWTTRIDAKELDGIGWILPP